MSGVEKASGQRFGPFPESWGIPRGSADSEERADWVFANVIKHGTLTPEQRTRVTAARLSAIRARLAELEARRAELDSRRLQ